MPRQLFGTDGIRGVAGEYPLDAKTVYAFGAALGDMAIREHGAAQVLIGMDTRESGPWMAACVAGGLAKAGAVPRFAGLITTPGVAYLTRSSDFVAGVMISASHNPFADNGLKVFDHSGFKLPDQREHDIEREIFALLDGGLEPHEAELPVDEQLDEDYLEYLLSTFHARLDGLALAIDCANGASSYLAPKLFARLGAKVNAIAVEPNGRNINLNCGALHLGGLREHVLKTGSALGVAFDGDADRALFVSGSGRIIDGDAVMLICGRDAKQCGRLPQDTVVATVMSNLGLELAFQRSGITMTRAKVGDRYVLEDMLKLGATLGGEQSGHVIFRDHSTTGDGLLTALRVLEIVQRTGKSLDELVGDLAVFPQILTNIRVANKRPLEELPAAQAEIRAAEQDFAGAGRVLVRFSGTEPLVRVMVEGEDQAKVDGWAERIANVIRTEMGA